MVPLRFELGEHETKVGEGTRLALEVLSRGPQDPVEVQSFQSFSGDGIHGSREGRLQGGTQQQVILRRHEVQRRSHQRCPDHLSLLHKARELLAPEVPEAGPQADVWRARDLSLETGQALYGVEDGDGLAL